MRTHGSCSPEAVRLQSILDVQVLSRPAPPRKQPRLHYFAVRAVPCHTRLTIFCASQSLALRAERGGGGSGRQTVPVLRVSDEFGAYRDELRRKLTRPNVEVKIQEDFKALGGYSLSMLEIAPDMIDNGQRGNAKIGRGVRLYDTRDAYSASALASARDRHGENACCQLVPALAETSFA